MNKSTRAGRVFSIAVQTAGERVGPGGAAMDGCIGCTLYKGTVVGGGAERQAPPTSSGVPECDQV